MRAFIALSLLVVAGAAAWLAVSNRPSRSPVELKLVGSKSIGLTSGKEFQQVTLRIRNRDRAAVVFEKVEEIQAQVGGGWIEVDQTIDSHRLAAGQKIQKRLYLPAGAAACRLRFDYHSLAFQSETWMARGLRSLGPTAARLVGRSARLREWVWPDESHPGWQEIILEVKLPPGPGQPVGGHNPHAVDALTAPAGSRRMTPPQITPIPQGLTSGQSQC